MKRLISLAIIASIALSYTVPVLAIENVSKNEGISNSQLYKQAGNSIVVKVLEGIFESLFLYKDIFESYVYHYR